MGDFCYLCGGSLPPDGVGTCPYCGLGVIEARQPVAVSAAASDAPAAVPVGAGAGLNAEASTQAAAAATIVIPTYQEPYQTATPEHTRVLIGDAEQLGRRWGKPRPRVVIAVCGVLVLLIGGGVAYELLKPAPPSPQSTVRQFFADLSNGDTTSAMTLVDKTSLGEPQLGADPTAFAQLRSDAVFRAPDSRPTDVTVSTTNTGENFGNQPLTAVRVSYKAGGQSLTQTIVVQNAPSGSSSPFLLENPFLGLEVLDPTSQQVTINGVAAGTSEIQTIVFPGAYTATLTGTALLAGATQTATATGGTSSGGSLTVTFPAPALAPGAETAIQGQIKNLLDSCAQSTSPAPPNCPFSIFPGGSDDSVQWKIMTYPSPTITPAASPSGDEQVDFTDQSQDGVVAYTDTYTDFTGTQQTNTGQTQFAVSGYATATGSDITVTFSNIF